MEGHVGQESSYVAIAPHAKPSATPSKVDRLFLAIDRLPGPPELFYAAVGIGIAVAAQAMVWADGALPTGAIETEVVQPPLVAALLLGLTHVLTRVGGSAFDDFRPALGEGGEIEQHRLALTSIPDRVALVSVIGGVAFVLLGYFLFVAPYATARPQIVEMLTGPLWLLAGAAVGLFVAHDIRQPRTVATLSRTAPHLSILKPTTINSFSRLRALTWRR